MPQLMGVLQPIMSRRSSCGGGGCGGEGMVTGGISKDSSGGGGCLHWGSGPARRRVWRSGPACITACKSFPFSGNGFSGTSSGGGGGNWGGGMGSTTGDETMLSSQSDDEKPLLESIPLLGSSSMLEIPERGPVCCCCCCCWSRSFSRRSLWHFSCASSLSLMALLSRSLRLSNWSSLFLSSSWTANLVCSSSKEVYKRELLSSSILCMIKTDNTHE